MYNQQFNRINIKINLTSFNVLKLYFLLGVNQVLILEDDKEK